MTGKRRDKKKSRASALDFLAKDTSLIQNAHPFGFTVCRVNTLVVSRLFRLPCEHALYVEK